MPADHPDLVWTREAPTVEGYFWHRWPLPKSGRTVEMLRVVRRHGALVAWIPDESPGIIPIEQFRDDCEWSGPIPLPKEATGG